MTNTLPPENSGDSLHELTLQLNDALALDVALAGVKSSGTGHAAAALSERLFSRVRRSVLSQQGVLTVRHGDTPWSDWHDGVRSRDLRDDGTLRCRMLELEPAAMLPFGCDSDAMEVLVLRGKLTGPALLEPQSFLLCTRSASGAWTAPQGALLYVRELIGRREALPEAEARWWPASEAAPLMVAASSDGWLSFSEGVEIKPLSGTPDAISMLARFEPGAQIGRHSHGLSEDCVIVQGDLYLGDLLLLEGEYQLAPAGTEHEGVASDHGSVLYFHGAISSELRGEP